MGQYQLSNKAAEDIAKIYDYTHATLGVLQAEAYLVKIHETLQILNNTPEIGSLANDIRKSYRRFPVLRHMIYFKILDDNILVIRVLHQQMQYTLHLTN